MKIKTRKRPQHSCFNIIRFVAVNTKLPYISYFKSVQEAGLALCTLSNSNFYVQFEYMQGYNKNNTTKNIV